MIMMSRLRWIALGYGVLGVVLFVSSFPESITILSDDSLTVSNLGTLAICTGSVGMILISTISVLKPESKIALGPTADFRVHLYGIWVAVIFATVGVAF